MEKITVTRALAKLKLLDKQINKKIDGSLFSSYKVGGKNIKDEFNPVQDLQAVTDLIDFRAKLKTGIMKSNSTTFVQIGKVKMTVVEAIETKDSIAYRQSLLRKIKNDISNAEEAVEYGNEQVKDRLDKMLVSSFGRDSKPKEEDIKAISKPFLDNNEYELIKSDKIEKVIATMEDEIDTFISEVDMVLSESNAVTTIEV